MTALIVIGAVLLALVLIGLLPVGVNASMDGENFGLRVIAGPKKITVLPKKAAGSAERPGETEEKKAKKKKKKKKKQKKQQPEAGKTEKKQPAPKKKVPVGELMAYVGPLLEVLKDFLDSFRRHLTIRELTLHVHYGSADPAQAAERYGQAWMAIGCAMPILQQAFTIRKTDVHPVWDGTEPGFSAEASVTVTICIWELMGMLVRYGIRTGKIAIPLLKTLRGGKKQKKPPIKEKQIKNTEESGAET